jgi:hypothetical protein
MNRKTNIRPNDFIFRFADALHRQLEADYERYGDEWRKLPREGQEDRIYQRLEQYWVEFSRDEIPIPWLKIAGLALIAWIRDTYPKSYAYPD